MSELDKLRSEIDKTDSILLETLRKRAKLVQQVGEVKSKHAKYQNQIFINSGREADMMRDILSHENIYDKKIIFSIWRAIITGSLKIETKLEAIYTKSDQIAENHLNEYFVHNINLTSFAKFDDSINYLVNNKEAILSVSNVSMQQAGFFAAFNNIIKQKDIFCFAMLPFIKNKENEDFSLLFARVQPRKSRNDMGLFKAELVNIDINLPNDFTVLAQTENQVIFLQDGFYQDAEHIKVDNIKNISFLGNIAKAITDFGD